MVEGDGSLCVNLLNLLYRLHSPEVTQRSSVGKVVLFPGRDLPAGTMGARGHGCLLFGL